MQIHPVARTIAGVLVSVIAIPVALNMIHVAPWIIVWTSLFAAAIVLVIGHSFSERSWKRNAMPIALMAIGTALFVGGVGWYLVRRQDNPPAHPTIAPPTIPVLTEDLRFRFNTPTPDELEQDATYRAGMTFRNFVDAPASVSGIALASIYFHAMGSVNIDDVVSSTDFDQQKHDINGTKRVWMVGNDAVVLRTPGSLTVDGVNAGSAQISLGAQSAKSIQATFAVDKTDGGGRNAVAYALIVYAINRDGKSVSVICPAGVMAWPRGPGEYVHSTGLAEDRWIPLLPRKQGDFECHPLPDVVESVPVALAIPAPRVIKTKSPDIPTGAAAIQGIAPPVARPPLPHPLSIMDMYPNVEGTPASPVITGVALSTHNNGPDDLNYVVKSAILSIDGVPMANAGAPEVGVAKANNYQQGGMWRVVKAIPLALSAKTARIDIQIFYDEPVSQGERILCETQFYNIAWPNNGQMPQFGIIHVEQPPSCQK